MEVVRNHEYGGINVSRVQSLGEISEHLQPVYRQTAEVTFDSSIIVSFFLLSHFNSFQRLTIEMRKPEKQNNYGGVKVVCGETSCNKRRTKVHCHLLPLLLVNKK